KRFGQFLLVVFLGVTITFFVTNLTPIDTVEESIGAITQMGQSDPNAIELMRKSLRELYGMEGSIWQQYLHLWLRLATGDLGPSLSAFPT
ncbi:ABC transporter permease, partial [Rhizobium ruizarguesonis]